MEKNYNYEEPILLQNPQYIQLMKLTQKLSQKYKYLENIQDSHDVVAYLMIFMNYHCAKKLFTYGNGIFRSTTTNTKTYINTQNNTNTNNDNNQKSSTKIKTCDNLPEDVNKFIQLWNSNTSVKYITQKKNNGRNKNNRRNK